MTLHFCSPRSIPYQHRWCFAEFHLYIRTNVDLHTSPAAGINRDLTNGYSSWQKFLPSVYAIGITVVGRGVVLFFIACVFSLAGVCGFMNELWYLWCQCFLVFYIVCIAYSIYTCRMRIYALTTANLWRWRACRQATYQIKSNQTNYFIVRLKVDQRAGQLSLPH